MAIARAVGAIAGALTLVVCVSLVTGFVIALADIDASVGGLLVGIAIAAAVGAGGVLLCYVCARSFAKVLLALLSLYLITGGFLLAVFAPVLRQMNSPDIAEYTAFAAFFWFGIVAMCAGAGLAAVCVRWALRPHARQRLWRAGRFFGSAYGVMLGISGLFTLLLVFAAASGDAADPTVERAIAIGAFAMLSFVPGLILTYQGISASMGEGSREYRIPQAAWGFALFGLVLLAGGLIMRAETPIAGPMPVLHIVAAAVPGLTLLALVSWGAVRGGHLVRGLTWRQVTVSMAIAMTLGTAIAVYVESLGSIGAIVLLLVHNGAFEFARDFDDVSNVISDARFVLTDEEQFVANLVTAALLAPIAEEFAKGLGPRLMMRRDTTRLQAFVLGAAAGAAFGFFEGLLYGVSGIQDDLAQWWVIMLVRGGSTTLHVMNSAVVGLAWWYWSFGKRPRLGTLLFVAAVLSHAFWNAFAVTLDSRIFGIDTLSQRTIETIAYIVVGVIAVAYLVALPLIARALRRADDVHVAETPLASMSPWVA